MWETPFDPSMLDGRVLISCPNGEKVSELMETLYTYGVKWFSGCILVPNCSYWHVKGERTCYRVCNKLMNYASVDYYEQDEHFRNYIKCTFYGLQDEEFEVADDESLFSFLGIKQM